MSRPKDAQYEWTVADNGKSGPVCYSQHRWYKFENDQWYSWSFMFEQWNKSRNPADWFTREIIQGYFVPLKDLSLD